MDFHVNFLQFSGGWDRHLIRGFYLKSKFHTRILPAETSDAKTSTRADDYGKGFEGLFSITHVGMRMRRDRREIYPWATCLPVHLPSSGDQPAKHRIWHEGFGNWGVLVWDLRMKLYMSLVICGNPFYIISPDLKLLLVSPMEFFSEGFHCQNDENFIFSYF